MIQRILIGLMVFLLLVGISVAWKIHQIGQPIQVNEIPIWRLIEKEPDHWLLEYTKDSNRKTDAWIKSPLNHYFCDTLIIVAGVEEGREFLLLDKWVSTNANMVLLEQPIRDFIHSETFKNWGLVEWWNFPERLRWEFLHSLGALKALFEHISMQTITESSLFSGRVVLAGGSLGAPYPVILSSFYPEKVSGLMIIYAFTNFWTLFKMEIYRQGLIHFRIPESNYGIIASIKRTALGIIAGLMSAILGNMLKFAQIELYLSNVKNTPIHFINGKNDYLITEETYMPMWNAAPDPKTELWLEGNHINPSNPEEVNHIFRLMNEWINLQKLSECNQ